MNDKVLVIIYVPFIEKKYEVYIPINKKIGYIKQIIVNSIKEQNDGNLDDMELTLYDKQTGSSLQNDAYVKDSTIRNGSVLFLV